MRLYRFSQYMAIALSNILLTVLSYILLGEIIVGPRFSEILSVLTYFTTVFFFQMSPIFTSRFSFCPFFRCEEGSDKLCKLVSDIKFKSR